MLDVQIANKCRWFENSRYLEVEVKHAALLLAQVTIANVLIADPTTPAISAPITA